MSVAISATMRNSLNALQTITAQSNVSQNRLSTGLKVSSALDNPTNYFTAQGLNDRAKDLGNLLDGIGSGLQVLKAADEGIKSISKLVETAKGLASAAKQLPTTADRASLVAQYTSIIAQITTVAGDSSFNGTNLIKGVTAPATVETLSVKFSEGASKLDVVGVQLDSGTAGLNITAPQASWAATTDIDADVVKLDAALVKLRTTAATFGANSAIISTRQDFTKNLISTLKTGADNLVMADQNEEAANLLSLQTRQQLAQTSMSMANQSQQAILRLF
ncbi:flagellin [Bosea sp. (in: a-proteobacteria)]|uniref:flagellin N-terminal helical domain-containing protein n=1 Tax=Bosea sp. (in: a-proteobacteria) TaxID=1871050 RepID=UPI002733D6C6|nr:flagellin [Bosea sp. (in: a-proteobacteria)]MDP3408110.1 flagellin [Bosea sp. (in: a-proteobacteria)]